MSKKFKIGEVEQITGLSAKIIRRYESDGVLGESSRDESGYRVFNESDIIFFKLLAKMKKINLSEKSIKLFLESSKHEDGDVKIEEGLYLKILNELEKAEDDVNIIKKLLKENYEIKS